MPRVLCYRLRLTLRQMNNAVRRMTELQMRLPRKSPPAARLIHPDRADLQGADARPHAAGG
jgi:hypothetical protein